MTAIPAASATVSYLFDTVKQQLNKTVCNTRGSELITELSEYVFNDKPVSFTCAYKYKPDLTDNRLNCSTRNLCNNIERALNMIEYDYTGHALARAVQLLNISFRNYSYINPHSGVQTIYDDHDIFSYTVRVRVKSKTFGAAVETALALKLGLHHDGSLFQQFTHEYGTMTIDGLINLFGLELYNMIVASDSAMDICDMFINIQEADNA